MADELTRKLMTELDEMEPEEAADAPRMAAQLQHRHRDAIEGGLQGTGAPQVANLGENVPKISLKLAKMCRGRRKWAGGGTKPCGNPNWA